MTIRVPSKNWNGIKYQWFNISTWDDFIKKSSGDIECINHNPAEGWKDFWKFCFSWMAWSGQKLPESIPLWAEPVDIDEQVVKSEMTKWRKIILDNNLEISKAKLEGKSLTKYIDTLIYFGWKYPTKPNLLIDINKDITSHYFNKKRMGKKTKYEKKDRSPFCYEPLALKRSGDKVDEFYFTATNKITKAFIEAEDGGEIKKYTNEKDVPKNATKRYFVGGGVSDVTRDLDNERMSDSCIKAMKESATNGDIPLRNAHSKEWDSDIGKLVEIDISDDDKSTLLCKFELNPFDEDAMAKKLWYAVNKGKKIGFSIGGIVHKYFNEYDREVSKEITVYDDIELKEVSVTASPANTNTFIHAISKAMKQLEKKPLTSATRRKLPKTKFAYVDEKGVGHLPIHDASHTRNAMARFNQTQMPASAKAGAWRKILAAARRFGIKVNTKKSIVKSSNIAELEKFNGVQIYFDVQKDYFTDILQQMRDDLKAHMDSDEEDEEELQDILEEMEEKLDDIDEDVDEKEDDEPEDEDGENEEKCEFSLLVQIISMLSRLDYPSGAVMPENYLDIIQSLPAEAFIYVEGEKLLPHHNMDYTVNRDLLQYQLKRLMDGEIFVDADEYLEILNHLAYHMMEKPLKKSTEEESQPVVIAEDVTTPEAAPVEQPAETETVTETVEATEANSTEEVKEEVKTEEVIETKEEVKEPVVETETPKEPTETESEKSLKTKVEELEKKAAELAAKLEQVEKEPVFKTATDTVNVVKEGAISGAELSSKVGYDFDVNKSYTEDEAVAEVAKFKTYDTYTVKQTIRSLFK